MARGLAHAVGSQVWDLNKADELALEALALAGKLSDRAAESKAYWILLLVNRFGKAGARKAAEYGERSLALARELGLQEQLALTLKDLAVAYAVMGRFRESGTLGREAVDLWRQLDNKPMLAEALGGRGRSACSTGEFDEAIAAGEESAALNRSIHNRFGLSINGGFSAMAHEELGNMAAAIQGTNEAPRSPRKSASGRGFPGWPSSTWQPSTPSWAISIGRSSASSAPSRRPILISLLGSASRRPSSPKSISSGDSPSSRQRCSRPTGI